MGQLYSHLVFQPPSPTYESYDGRMLYLSPDAEGLPRVCSASLVWLETSLGARIPGAWVQRRGSPFVILFAHSNGDDLGSAMKEARRLSEALELSVFAFDYTGYGISEMPKKRRRATRPGCVVEPSLETDDRRRAVPSEDACYADMRCAYEYLVRECRVLPKHIILVGRSIGSGPTVHCAASNEVGGLVLVAPIASAMRVALKRLNITLPLIDTFPNIDKVRKVQCPVLVIHGDEDEVVPKRHAELIVSKASSVGNAVEPLWVPAARHNNVVEDHQSLVFGRYRIFLKEIQMRTQREYAPLPRPRGRESVGQNLIKLVNAIPDRAVGWAGASFLCFRPGSESGANTIMEADDNPSFAECLMRVDSDRENCRSSCLRSKGANRQGRRRVRSSRNHSDICNKQRRWNMETAHPYHTDAGILSNINTSPRNEQNAATQSQTVYSGFGDGKSSDTSVSVEDNYSSITAGLQADFYAPKIAYTESILGDSCRRSCTLPPLTHVVTQSMGLPYM